MERYLSKEERVHHINGDKLNNFIGNLMLFPSHSDHLKHHMADPDVIERLRAFGHKRVQKAETREKCRVSKLGNKHCVGRVYSQETLKKMSESAKKWRQERKAVLSYATY